jgi:hypothetical protein
MNRKDSTVFAVYRLTFIVMPLYLMHVLLRSETRPNR